MSRIDFFSKIEDKYNIGLKRNRGIICRIDARKTTGNKNIDLLDEKHGFTYALKSACLEFSKKYQSVLVYVAVDEVNFLIVDTKRFLNSMKSNYAQEITGIICQEFSYIFHQYYDKFTLFAGRSFSVYKNNFNSYLIYRKHTNKSVLTVYFFKNKQKISVCHKSYKELDALGLNIEEYKNRTVYQKEGIVYYKGLTFEIEDVLINGIDNLISPKTVIFDKNL